MPLIFIKSFRNLLDNKMMKFITIIFAILLIANEVSCKFKCVTDTCMTQEEMPKKFGGYFRYKKQENAPCLMFSSPTNLVRSSTSYYNQI